MIGVRKNILLGVNPRIMLEFLAIGILSCPLVGTAIKLFVRFGGIHQDVGSIHLELQPRRIARLPILLGCS